MTAAELLPMLSGVRPRGKNRWGARCPGHDDSSPSLSITETADRVLLRCWAGCSIEAICAALGITVADLFHERRGKPDIAAQRRRLAVQGFERWRQSEAQAIAEDLRRRDFMIREIERFLADGWITEAQALANLSHEYDGYSEREYQLGRLIRNDRVLELWRESRRAA